MWIAIGISAGVAIALLIAAIASYNSASKKKLRVDNAFSQLKIQYRRRADLIPLLADVVKSYVKNGGGVFSSAYSGRLDTLQEISDSERALKGLFAAANKAEIKSDANYLQLQNELVKLEKAIAVSRGFYNDSVMIYNRTVHTFPINIFAKMFGFKPAEFLDSTGYEAPSALSGAKCPSCGAVATSEICSHCGTRIPLL